MHTHTDDRSHYLDDQKSKTSYNLTYKNKPMLTVIGLYTTPTTRHWKKMHQYRYCIDLQFMIISRCRYSLISVTRASHSDPEAERERKIPRA